MTPQGITIYTPEHVAIDLVAAGFGRRFIAFILDLIVLSAASTLIRMLTMLLPEWIGIVLASTAVFALGIAYFIFFEVRHQGQTPGKRIMRLRVVDTRGLPLRLPQSLIRTVLRTLDMMPCGGVGLLSCLCDHQRRRLGDLAAGTMVVEERHGPAADQVLLAERRQNSLDQPRLRRLIAHRIGIEEREFLLALCIRAQRIDQRARFDLFEAVGQEYRKRLDIAAEELSDENLVRGLVALLHRRD